jgi:hypothetical protein
MSEDFDVKLDTGSILKSNQRISEETALILSLLLSSQLTTHT